MYIVLCIVLLFSDSGIGDFSGFLDSPRTLPIIKKGGNLAIFGHLPPYHSYHIPPLAGVVFLCDGKNGCWTGLIKLELRPRFCDRESQRQLVMFFPTVLQPLQPPPIAESLGIRISS